MTPAAGRLVIRLARTMSRWLSSCPTPAGSCWGQSGLSRILRSVPSARLTASFVELRVTWARPTDDDFVVDPQQVVRDAGEMDRRRCGPERVVVSLLGSGDDSFCSVSDESLE